MEPRTFEVDGGRLYDVIVVGAGPVGLLLANILGREGRSVLVIERLTSLIDYPRGVGMDDECLRAIQSVGLVDKVLPHTTPNQWMRFVTGGGRCFASIEPRTDEFGWPRRNAFIQPLTDQVLVQGLERFKDVHVEFGVEAESIVQGTSEVQVGVICGDAERHILKARYVVGCDGGRSFVRKALEIPFEGSTASNRWLVVDVANDPVGTPNAYLHCDPARPYVSIALPHGVRRFEFMLFPNEAPEDQVSELLLRSMLKKLIPEPDRVELIRARIYTHHGRLAQSFRRGRVLIAGDAAHLMPVWQGQGYNSGVRDAANLGWKLALVTRGLAGDLLLDTYETERRDHARAMISLSETAGGILSPTNRLVAALRDGLTLVLNWFPLVKRYFLEMRFKPMPRYKQGALQYLSGFSSASPVGRMFIQPRVQVADGGSVRLDDAIGAGFALLSWGVDPTRWLTPAARVVLKRLETKLCWIVPTVQADCERAAAEEVEVLGDVEGRLKEWFGAAKESVVLLRPDRFVCLACSPIELSRQLELLVEKLALQQPDAPADEPRLHVAHT